MGTVDSSLSKPSLILCSLAKIKSSYFREAGLSGLHTPQTETRSFALQPRQPLPGILDFGQAGVGVFKERKEFLAVPPYV